MRIKPHHVSFSCVLLFFLFDGSQAQPSTTGYTCTANQTTYPCQTYAFYQATAPDFLDLASVGDLFHVSRLMISEPSYISSPSSPLIPDQFLFVPITCSCNSINTTLGSLSAANLTYTIQGGDTFSLVSTSNFQNLTTYQSVEVFNPTFVPTQLEIGDRIVFPIFCKCPNETQVQNGVNYLVSYVFQPSDNLSLVASRFGVQTQAITNVNGNDIQPFDTIFIPVNRLPVLSQPKNLEKPLITLVRVTLIQGSFYKGSIDGDIYAIKKMKRNACEELKILQKVNHGNLVKLEGFCIDPEDTNCYLLYEFIENGSLSSWLQENQNEKLNWKTRLRIAVDVANCLQYIHEHTRPRVVHKDLKSSNILLDSNMRAKIANFGLAKSGCNAITMHIVGTQGYIAPEYPRWGGLNKEGCFLF
ncbi:hypothetical protein CRYUN_Cryun36dG0065800 [Craigia yunnanensis]